MACTPRNQVEKTSGDDWRVAITLLLDGVVKNVSGATIRAACVDEFSGDLAGSSVSVSEGASGADWTNGIVVAVFPRANTITIPSSTYHIEVEVTMAGEVSTWHSGTFTVRQEALT
jgi:hypothetical protein